MSRKVTVTSYPTLITCITVVVLGSIFGGWLGFTIAFLGCLICTLKVER